MGEERETTFRYQLPAGTVAREGAVWHYNLTLQKQPGTNALPVAVRLRLPRGAVLTSASVAPIARELDTVVFTLHLDRDQQLDITFDRL